MEHSGFWSLLPPLIAIALAIRTRQVYLSLLTGIFLGYIVVHGWNLWAAFIGTLEGLVHVFADAGNTRTILFCTLVGALMVLTRRAGGVEGFLQWIQSKTTQSDGALSPQKAQLLAFGTGILIFIETSISSLTVGTVFRPLFDKLGVSRDKLAYLADSSSAPSSILIPFNAWGAFIMGLLMAEGIKEPFTLLLKVMPFNFYPIITIAIAMWVITRNWNIGPMKKAEQAQLSSSISSSDSAPEDWLEVPLKSGIIPRKRNMLIPIAVMVVSMPLILLWSGWGNLDPELSGLEKMIAALGAGSGSKAVLTAVVLSLLSALILYAAQGIMGPSEWMNWTLKGSAGLLPLALLMLLAFAIGDVCRLLGTGVYVAGLASEWLHPALLPALLFVLSSFIAFSTGTSWGTFAIMLAIALPMTAAMGTDPVWVIAAVLGGGVFGDHCSPISDTTIISSLAAGTRHISHVKTQLPYALLAGAITTILYLILGFLSM